MVRITVAAAVLFLAVPAIAEQPNYNFVQLSYQEIDLDVGRGLDVDGDGFGLGGSVEFGQNFFGLVNYSDIGFDFSVDLTQIQVGVGYKTPVNDNTSFFATASYLEADFSAPGGGGGDDSGFGLGVGIRGNISELIELFGGITYSDLGDGSTGLGGGILFNITDAFALGVSATTDDDATTLAANARFYWGN